MVGAYREGIMADFCGDRMVYLMIGLMLKTVTRGRSNSSLRYQFYQDGHSIIGALLCSRWGNGDCEDSGPLCAMEWVWHQSTTRGWLGL